MNRHLHRAALLSSVLFVVPALAHEVPLQNGAAPRHTELFAPGVLQASGAVTMDAGAPVLVPGLGSYGMRIETVEPLAQTWFDQGLGHLWGFNHAEAVRAFRMAQSLDPNCAMCLWGEAHALGPNINDGMHPEAEARALKAATQAADLAKTPLERALTAALVARYAAAGTGDRAALNQAYADAMGKVAEAFPQDANVLVLYADALMNVQPWDYWEAGGITPKGGAAQILTSLEAAMTIAPDHPAAMHLYIHAVEASINPARGEAAADRLAAAHLFSGHLVHMPSHIYNRIGRYADSIAVNKAAIVADEAFFARAGSAASPLYQFGYYPHNVHFLLVGAQSAGLAEESIAAADKLAAITSDKVSADYAWVQAIRTAPYTVHAQMSDAATILALPAPSAATPFVMGFLHYARGLALVRSGNLPAAQTERDSIEAIIAGADLSGLEAQYLPARDLLGIASRIVGARIAESQGDGTAAVTLLQEAAAMEGAVPYMEPSYWYAPVQRTLGAVLLSQGRAQEAKTAFETALAHAPRDGWALWGLWQAEEKLGDAASIATAKAAFDEAWLGAPDMPVLDRL